MKTHEKIKKGLECRIRGVSEKCDRRCDKCDVYIPGYNLENRYSDAFAYIQQLEEREKSLYAALHAVMYIVDKWLDVEPYDFDKDDGTVAITRASNAREVALRAIEKAEREKDAVLLDWKRSRLKGEAMCWTCRFCENGSPCLSPVLCEDGECWEWRGPCEENTEGET